MKDLWEEPYHIVIEVENRQCKILNMLKTLGIKQIRVVDIRGFNRGLTRHLVEAPLKYANKVLKAYSTETRRSNRLSEKTFFWFESEGCNVCNTILSHGSFLISGRTVHDFTFIYSFVVPSFDVYKSIVSILEKNNLGLKILKVKKFNPKGTILTRKQERILWLALKTGFFSYPRKISVAELSRVLGIKPSTLSETIRRGMRRLLEYYFEVS